MQVAHTPDDVLATLSRRCWTDYGVICIPT